MSHSFPRTQENKLLELFCIPDHAETQFATQSQVGQKAVM